MRKCHCDSQLAQMAVRLPCIWLLKISTFVTIESRVITSLHGTDVPSTCDLVECRASIVCGGVRVSGRCGRSKRVHRMWQRPRGSHVAQRRRRRRRGRRGARPAPADVQHGGRPAPARPPAAHGPAHAVVAAAHLAAVHRARVAPVLAPATRPRAGARQASRSIPPLRLTD